MPATEHITFGPGKVVSTVEMAGGALAGVAVMNRLPPAWTGNLISSVVVGLSAVVLSGELSKKIKNRHAKNAILGFGVGVIVQMAQKQMESGGFAYQAPRSQPALPAENPNQ